MTLSKESEIILIHPQDNVAVALAEIPSGRFLDPPGLACRQVIPAGHKVAVRPIAMGEAIIRYGQYIGRADLDIRPGDHVHTHNMSLGQVGTRVAGPGAAGEGIAIDTEHQAFFDGFVRADGRVGSRNYIGLVTSVNCAAGAARLIAEAFTPAILADFPMVDGVVVLNHQSGCGMALYGEGFDILQRTLAGFINHPNFSHIVMIGLGCECNQIQPLLDRFDIDAGQRVHKLVLQENNGTRRTVGRGIELIKDLLPLANRAARSPVPVSKLMVGLECGGSDAYSGISANPALGAAVDLLIAHGGTAVLSETTEIYGAEHLLAKRAISPEVRRDILDLIKWWEAYTAKHGVEINNNPSPGNKAGGLTTILEKSLGAVAKGGSSLLRAVYQYAEPIREKGLVFMNSPGFDLVSLTGKIASGVQLNCFTTGRGSIVEVKPAPVLKLATNSYMYAHMADDMDIDCGRILTGELTIPEMGRLIFDQILATASGTRTKSELMGFSESGFSPWPMGAVV